MSATGSAAPPGPGGLFVTATDTGVGKTFIACSLARQARDLGRIVAPRKPVESGCTEHNGVLVPEDAVRLTAAAGLAAAGIEDVNRYRFAEALAPDLAARRAGQPLFLADLIAACACPADAWRLTEGAGGLYSPLCEDGLNADLAQALGDPVVLVAEDRLGTLSGCLLALEALERRGLYLAAVILNRRRPGTDPAMDNRAALARYTEAPVFSFPEGLSERELDQRLSTWIGSTIRPPEPGAMDSASDAGGVPAAASDDSGAGRETDRGG